MFGMSEAHYNIVKNKCDEMSEELKNELKRGFKYDCVAKIVIDKHYKQVSTLLTKTQFIWLSGYLNGRYSKTFDYE